jgi:hypothetical protein
MNIIKTVLSIIICVTLMSVSSVYANPNKTMTVLDVYASLPVIVGDTITVNGYYYSPDYPVLGLDQEMFEIRLEPSPHSLLKLTGLLPDSSFSTTEVTGIIDTTSRPYPFRGVTYIGTLNVLESKQLKTIKDPSLKKQNRLKDLQKLNHIKADDCTFAMLICSDNKRPDFWMDMVNFWYYVLELGVKPENIMAFYGNGKSRNESEIPSSALRAATKNEIEMAFHELQMLISLCEAEGKKAKLIKLVTDHGSGYHTGSSSPTGPQASGDGWASGHIDKDGDESDRIPEKNLKFDFTKGPAVGKTYYYDLDGDGKDDLKVVNNATGGIVAYAYNKKTGKWVEAGRDTNGDKIIDSKDGGLDLNGDGDKNDAFAWDEDLWMSQSGESILDDEWASWQKALSEACLDSIFELIDCCFSGGFIKDMEREIPCKTAVRMATACDEGEYSYGSAKRGGGWFAHEFLMALWFGWLTWEDVCCAGGEWSWSAQTPQYFKKDGEKHGGKAPYRYGEDFGNPPKNGWQYYANEGKEMRDMVWQDGKYVDPKYGKANNSKGLIIPDEVNGVNVKIALHPNVEKDLGGKKEKKFRYRVNAKALPEGASLKIWIANSDNTGQRPNPADTVKVIMPNEYFKGGDIISRKWPVILGKDIQHCQWIIAEVDPGKGQGPGGRGWKKLRQPGELDTLILDPPDTLILIPPERDGIIRLDPWADFGDAPDNSLTSMLAGYDPPFETIIGKFPTLLATINSRSAQPGNHHWDPFYIGLGPDASLEADAYAPGADEDGFPNIDPFLDVADQDSVCDGLLNTYLPIGVYTQLRLIIKALANTEAYINVLCDWNCDGIWQGTDPNNGSPEWVVQNQKVNLVPVYNYVITDTFLVTPDIGKTWMRINLSLEPVKGTDWDGSGEFEYGEVEDYLIEVAEVSGIEEDEASILPEKYTLSHNYPNPFNPVSKIEYTIPGPSRVTLIIYNILGNKVRTLVDGEKPAGRYDVIWDGRNSHGQLSASGTYILKMIATSVTTKEVFMKTEKMLLMK